ncbi:MAG: hypothetical protein HQK81_02040 [Desulfovibrionaceae bacterium]|nr:hypothetical protein [Desulfovibrionaceae bacterium]MBF0512825.1 hypothetical protein [Desulfovibrionaceae bacterium]
MLAEEMYALRQVLSRNGIGYCYSGCMTEEILLGIGNAIRRHMQAREADAKTSRSVFAVFVEQVQNVIRYSAEKLDGGGPPEMPFGILAVGDLDGDIFVSCGNLVAAADVPRLRANLETIRGLDKQGLKSLHKDVLRGDVPEGSKGAGVGFIDIARRATRGIEFDFTPVDEASSFFTLKALF